MKTFLEWLKNNRSVVLLVLTVSLVGAAYSAGCQTLDPKVEVPQVIRDAVPNVPSKVPLSQTDGVIERFIEVRRASHAIDVSALEEFNDSREQAAWVRETLHSMLSFGAEALGPVVASAVPGLGAVFPVMAGLVAGLLGYRTGTRRGASTVVASVDALRAVSPSLDKAFDDLSSSQKSEARKVLDTLPPVADVVARTP